ncbi:HAD-IIIC family phosphatase [Streptomyces sp. NPDC012616]|uniref:HAD-IIIC family phosphatase n=1 Tax=Streptomyces sp. NPDC012616 TaxID=3364840 RepID=UPI0036E682E4
MADDLVARARALGEPGADPDPSLVVELTAATDPASLREAGRILEGVPGEMLAPRGSRLRPLRVAVVATFTAHETVPLIRAALLGAGILPELYRAPAHQLGGQLTSETSELAAFAPDVTLCLVDDGLLLPRPADLADPAALYAAMRERVAVLRAWSTAYAHRQAGHLVLHTIPLPAVRIRNLVSMQARAELGRVWRELNGELLRLAAENPRISVIDLEMLLVGHPTPLRDERLHRFAQMAWAPGVELLYAREAAAACRAYLGLSRKCLVLDLDNTLWNGVVGDDGPEGIDAGPMYPGNCHAELQGAVAALRAQGVLLATASKNEEAAVRSAFAAHPEFPLDYDSFVAHAENWRPKDGNIAALAEELGLGLDGFALLDDSAFECGLVRESLPQVRVVQLAGDPARHVTSLLEPGLFDTLHTTSADRDRAALYEARGTRVRERARHSSQEDYLASLGLEVTVVPAVAGSLARVDQLARRTNQFNLTGRLFPAPPPATAPSGGSASRVLAYHAADRFGDEGLVGAVHVVRDGDRWLLENWVMSCRVMARGVEFAVLHHLAEAARAAGAHTLVAGLRPTERNGPSLAFLLSAGFTPASGSAEEYPARYTLSLSPARRFLPAWITLRAREAETGG